MKKIFLASLFTCAALAQTAFATVYNGDYDEDDYPPEPKTVEISDYQLTHNSFFMEGNLGLGAVSTSGYTHLSGQHEGTAFDGQGLYAGFNFGLNIKRWATPYLGFNFTNGSGHVSFDRISDKIDNVDFFNFSVCLGTLVFPFRNVSGMEGIFAGFEIGWGGLEAEVENSKYDKFVNDANFNFKLELGNVWDLTPRWSIGVKGFLSFYNFFDDYDYDSYYYSNYDDYEIFDLSGVSVGLVATIIRR